MCHWLFRGMSEACLLCVNILYQFSSFEWFVRGEYLGFKMSERVCEVLYIVVYEVCIFYVAYLGFWISCLFLVLFVSLFVWTSDGKIRLSEPLRPCNPLLHPKQSSLQKVWPIPIKSYCTEFWL